MDIQLACFCGGVFEISFLLTGSIISFILTNVYNKIKYENFIKYKEKHKSCKCNCHDDER